MYEEACFFLFFRYVCNVILCNSSLVVEYMIICINVAPPLIKRAVMLNPTYALVIYFRVYRGILMFGAWCGVRKPERGHGL